jgi:hypothetical protein
MGAAIAGGELGWERIGIRNGFEANSKVGEHVKIQKLLPPSEK